MNIYNNKNLVTNNAVFSTEFDSVDVYRNGEKKLNLKTLSNLLVV